MTRFDLAVAQKYNLTRTFASKLIKSGKVSFEGRIISLPSTKVSENVLDDIFISQEDLHPQPVIDAVLPENIPFDVLFENDDVLVINKQAGMSVHTSQTEVSHTIANALAYRYWQIENPFSPVERYGIVHRLDKDTSGVLIIAKNRRTQAFLAKQFQERLVQKEYLAVVSGKIEKELIVDKAIARNKKDRKKMGLYENGRPSITVFSPKHHYMSDKNHTYTLLKVSPKTGRTHQIRVHAKSLGHPVVGDKIYNGEKNDHLLLHAKKLCIELPDIGKQVFEVKEPAYFDSFLYPLHRID